MKTAVKVLSIIDLVMFGAGALIFLIYGFILPVMLAYVLIFVPGIVFESVTLSQIKTKKPSVGIAVCDIIFGGVLGIAAGIVALCSKETDY